MSYGQHLIIDPKQAIEATDLPPNVERAARAHGAIAWHMDVNGCGMDDAITDMLVDLRHLCQREHLQFAMLDAIAGRHYVAETEPDRSRT